MVVKKRKKVVRMRGSGNHGWGSHHRGSGQRGGAGMAGTGKKADCKMPMVWKERYLGKHGFVAKGPVTNDCTITLKDIDQRMAGWMKDGHAKESKGMVELNLGALGYTKLLGTGRITRKLRIHIEKAAPGAQEKVKEAGGEIVLSHFNESQKAGAKQATAA
jgi:large subunit ribosomal protein L15